MTPVWRNDELEEAVIGALFLRGDDPEVLDVLSRLPASTFSVRQYREIYTGICRQARGGGVIDPLLLCESLPALQTTILAATRVSWAKSALLSYVDVLRRWICPYISRHLLSLNPLLARCRRYSRGER